MRKTCAMIDVSSLFLFFSSNTCELNRCRQSAGALLAAQQHSNKLGAHKTPRIGQLCPTQSEKRQKLTRH